MINFKEMENVKHGEFTLNGKQWRALEGGGAWGISANGLWIIMTDGVEKIRIHKKALLKHDADKAVALFN